MPTLQMGDQELAYTDRGTGETLLIYPDHLHASRGYEQEIDYFAERFRVIAFDYPGTGQSTRDVKYEDEREYDLWSYWSDFGTHLLMELGITSAMALGVGGGARAALFFAGHHSRVHDITPRVVIADSFLPSPDMRSLHRILDRREHYYVRQWRLLKEEHGEDWREVVDKDTAFLRRVADHGGYYLHEYVLNSIPCPVLLTGSLQDPLNPGLAQEYARLAGLIPDCSLYLASTAGHPHIESPWMWSNPTVFRAVVDLFLSRSIREP
jgi:valacyclovir hydrolase